MSLLLAACAPSSTSTPSTATPAEPAAPSGGTSGGLLGADAFAIKVEPIGHWHLLKPKKLVFTVTDTATGLGKAGLSPAVQVARTGSSSVSTRSLEKGQIVDEGNGIYSMEYTPGDMASYAFLFRFSVDGQEFASAPIPSEVVRDGEEGIKVEAKNTQYVYQIRYNWVPGHAHASDEDKVKMVFEIMRGIQEGADINWEKPYLNTVNHVIDADHPEVMVESTDGQVDEEIHPVYKGKGIYEAERIFTVAEVGKEKEYEIRFSFTDPYNGAKVTHSEPYKLRVSAPH
ncbi:MAG: hypothetical protein HYX83_01150 [Chloroflexi bacterium]|nr:hypothetical protein [Chloroflexota bacterium]